MQHRVYQKVIWHSVFIGIVLTVSASHASRIYSSSRAEVVCVASSWQTVVVFFAVNYAAHAMTIKSIPGERSCKTAARVVGALLLPFSSIICGCISIACAKVRGESDLDHALRAAHYVLSFEQRLGNLWRMRMFLAVVHMVSAQLNRRTPLVGTSL